MAKSNNVNNIDNLELTGELKSKISGLDNDEIFDLAKDYEDEDDFQNANRLYKYLANKGDTYGQNNLGWNYYLGRGVIEDTNKAAELFKPLAEQGIVIAIVNLAFCYEDSWQDKEAVKLYEKAALLGDIRAIQNLARCYLYGFGVKKNYDVAFKLFKGIELIDHEEIGYTHFSMARIYCNKKFRDMCVEKALKYYKKAIDYGDAYSFNDLGIMYTEGKLVNKDTKKGFKYFEKGMLLDDADSCVNLASAYEKGVGTKRDYNMALKYYKKAIELGVDCKKEYEKMLEKVNYEKKNK